MATEATDAPNMAFGPALRRARTAAGMSLTDLGRAVNYSKSQLSKVENGLARPTVAFARACDTVFGTGTALQELVYDRTGVQRRGRLPTGYFSGLPRLTSRFTGRAGELADVIAGLQPSPEHPSGPRICVVHGMPGVGKTALAVQAADRLSGLFPDGILFMDLHGHTPGMEPVRATDALDRLLRRLGFDGTHVPAHVDDRAGLLWDRLTARRMLLVLDNAASAAQVEPLLPTDPRCAVIVTSRDRLASLESTSDVEVGLLPVADAVALFRSVVVRAPSSDNTAEVIVRSCGLLPLTVRVAGARLRSYNGSELAELAERVTAREISGLGIADDGQLTVVTTFDASLSPLTADQRRTFTIIAQHPGADFSAVTAAAMTGLPQASIDSTLDRLCDAHLLIREAERRFRFHDVVREYAVSKADPAIVDEAYQRLINMSTIVTHRADLRIAPHRYHRPLDAGQPPTYPEPALDTRESALRWLKAEFDNLVAVCRLAARRGFDEHAWRIAHSLQGFAFLTKAWDAWAATQAIGLAAARRLGDPAAEGYLLNGLGLVHLERHEPDQAEALFQTARSAFTAVGDERGLASTIGNWAWVHHDRGNFEESLRAHERALEFHVRDGSTISAAVVLRGMALTEIGLGRIGSAIAHLRTALRTFEDHGAQLDLAMAWNCLGEAHQTGGSPHEAATAFQRAVEASEACGSRYELARGLEGLAAATPDKPIAASYLRTACRIYTDLGAPEAARLRRALETTA